MSSLNLFQTNKEPENPKTQVFENAEFGKIRVKGDSENPLFCLKDICEILEIQNVSDIANAIKREFGDGVDLTYPIIDSLGREQKATFISEPQLYFVLMRSDKPKAKPFRLWVTKEVLPSIRKNELPKDRKKYLPQKVSSLTKENAQIFIFENLQIRVFEINGEPMFLAMDIAKTLDYKDTEAMTRRLDDDETQNLQIVGFNNRGVILINESGLYNAILGSKKPEAKFFKKWVTKEVLPAIRKTGEYKIQKQETLISADFLRKIADEMEKKDLKISLLENQIESEKPLVEFSKQIATSANAISVRDFAKILYDENIKMGEKQLFHWLRFCGYLTSENMPYQRYLGAGYFEVKQSTYKTPYGEKSYTQTLITGKGQIYFCEKLRKEFK